MSDLEQRNNPYNVTQASRIYFLPNLMTAGNLFCGFAAVIKCIQARLLTDGGEYLALHSNQSWMTLYTQAVWLILAAVIFDSLDGRLLDNARGTGLTVQRYTPPSHGSVVVDADGTFHYTPAPGYVGPDSFTYTVVDAFGTEATGTVSITVVPQLPNTGADPRLWTLASLLVLLAGLAFATIARTRRRRMS